MDEAWKQLPCAAVIVCASVLGAGSARAEQPDVEPSASEVPVDPAQVPVAPTCGPACHTPGYQEEIQPPPPDDRIDTAPTCGPSCHGGYEEPDPGFAAPPPVEPTKKGCAVEDGHEHSPLGLAALSLGLLAGVAARRRRES